MTCIPPSELKQKTFVLFTKMCLIGFYKMILFVTLKFWSMTMDVLLQTRITSGPLI